MRDRFEKATSLTRVELRRRIDEVTREITKLPGLPSLKHRNMQAYEGFLERNRERKRQERLSHGIVQIEGTTNIMCIECGKFSSKYAAGKYRHEKTCSKLKDI